MEAVRMQNMRDAKLIGIKIQKQDYQNIYNNLGCFYNFLELIKANKLKLYSDFP